MVKKVALIVLLFTQSISCVMAKVVGTQGPVYEIKEQSALVWIKERLEMMQENGEIERQQQKLKERALVNMERPKPVSGLKNTEIARTFEKDLTVVVPADIKGPNGELIQKAGTKINPLTKVFSRKSLIFIDGDNQKQVNWALEEYKKRNGLAKLVLVNGPVLELMREHDVPFYFDQAGRLIQYFKIEQIPAVVSQKKDKLLISEVKI